MKMAVVGSRPSWAERIRFRARSEGSDRSAAQRIPIFKGVAGKILLTLTLVGIPVTAFATWLVYSASAADERNFALSTLSDGLGIAVTRFEESIADTRDNVLFLSHMPAIQGIIRADSNGNTDAIAAWEDRLDTIFADLFVSRPDYFQLRHIGPTGQELVRVDRLADGSVYVVPDEEMQDKGDRPYFIETAALADGQIYISAFELNRERGEIQVPHRPTYRVAAPVFGSDGTFHGIVIANVASDEAFARAAASITEEASLYITNQDGDYLVNPDDTRTFGFDLGQRYLMQDEIPEVAPLFDGTDDSVTATVRLAGHSYLLAAQRSYFDPSDPDRYLVIASLLPMSAASASESQLYTTTGVIAAILLFAGAIQISTLMRTVVGPLNRVETAARELGGGQRDVDLSDLTAREDEVGELARTFEGMADQIAEREDELVEKANELAQSNQELSQFAYVASHDLQEPLRMVASYLGLLSSRYQGKLDKEADEFIGYAVDGAERMKRLINDLLAYSRANNRALNVDTVSAAAIVERVLDTYAQKIEDAKAEIVVDPLPDIRVDETQIERLFSNLIDNALKYRSEAAPRIHVSAQPDGRYFQFTVADNGIGIDPKFQSKVFEIFARLHARHEYPGTGIGLASCRRVVERHGGRIWVETAPGGGSAFKFTLPGARESRRAQEQSATSQGT